MGCGGSKSAAIHPMPVLQAWSDDQTGKPATLNSNIKEFTTSTLSTDPADTIAAESQYGSAESVSSSLTTTKVIELRKGSANSADSGFGGNCGDDTTITTEKLTPTLSDPLQDDATNDAKILGPMSHRNGLPPVQENNRMSTHDKVSEHNGGLDPELSLENILQKRVQFANVLINELPVSSDIIKRPVSRGGVAFHIVNYEEEKQATHRVVKKPVCVLKYAQHKRASEVVTHDQLDEKLRAANQRRKDQEQMRLERIWAQEEKDRQVAEALAKFETMQIGLQRGRDKIRADKPDKVKQNHGEKPLMRHLKENHRIKT